MNFVVMDPKDKSRLIATLERDTIYYDKCFQLGMVSDIYLELQKLLILILNNVLTFGWYLQIFNSFLFEW